MLRGVRNSFSTSRRGGFTLIELMVVIGIIAVLLGLLFPAFYAARENAKTAVCMSNLHQIGAANVAYAMDNDGMVVPMDYRDMSVSPTANGYAISDSWATILVAGKYIPYPISTTSAPPDAPTVFRCPTGSSETIAVTNIVTGLPTSRTDGFGGTGALTVSKILMPGRAIYVWYGNNGDTGSPAWSPLKRIPPDDGSAPLPAVTHLSKIRKPSDLVFLFDGLAGNMQVVNANRLNARHNRQRFTNLLFFDAHAETWPTANLPGGAGNAGNAGPTCFSLSNLAKYARPVWRLDQ